MSWYKSLIFKNNQSKDVVDGNEYLYVVLNDSIFTKEQKKMLTVIQPDITQNNWWFWNASLTLSSHLSSSQIREKLKRCLKDCNFVVFKCSKAWASRTYKKDKCGDYIDWLEKLTTA